MTKEQPVHIRAQVLSDPQNMAAVVVRIDVWPLPNEQRVLEAVYEVARKAIHARLCELGLASPQWVDATARGRSQ